MYFAENGFELPDLLAGLIASYYNDITLLRTEDGELCLIIHHNVHVDFNILFSSIAHMS